MSDDTQQHDPQDTSTDHQEDQRQYEGVLNDEAYAGWRRAGIKVRHFPKTSGVYLMKDDVGRVIYIGKAKNLRSRAGSYFTNRSIDDTRISKWLHEIHDIDFMECASEVDALLTEARLIKDIQPPYNKEQRDDKSFPYIMITNREDYPRVEVTREPPDKNVRLYGPFTSAGSLNGALSVLQRIFKFRNCSLDIDANDEKWKWYRPCLLAAIDQCSAPCNLQISKADYAKDIRRLQMVLDGKKTRLLQGMKKEMQTASQELHFELAAKLRDEIKMLESLDRRGNLETHEQPEVFYTDPRKGIAGLKKVLGLDIEPRTIEGVDIAHLGGSETVASLVQFIDGLPFKPGYRRFRINDVDGIDDLRSIYEVVSRRFKRLSDEN